MKNYYYHPPKELMLYFKAHRKSTAFLENIPWKSKN